MADYVSSLTGEQIEQVLTGTRAVNGIVKSNGLGTFTAAAAGTDFAYPIISGAGNPTTLTIGAVNQLYLNTTVYQLFICTAISGSTYTWKSIGGAEFVVKGMYSTLAELQTAVPNPSVGDAYAVGTSASNVIYLWNGSTWANIGSLKGDAGDDGVSPGITITDITGGHRVTITDATHPSGQSFDVLDGSGNVNSVNGATGTVVLDGADINVDDTATTPQTIKAAITSQSTEIVALQGDVDDLETVTENIVGGDAWVSGTTYAVGDTCIYNNIAYRCITANSSSTFTSSEWEQISLKSLSDELTSTSLQTLNSGYGVYYAKAGNVVTIYCECSQDVSSSISVGTLPIGYRPKKNVYSTSFNSSAYIDVSTTGMLSMNPVGSGGWCLTAVSFVV